MPYRIAGIDVHKKKLAVVVADVEVEDEYQFERRWYGSNPEQLRVLSDWLIEQQVEEVVMESTAQYWKPVWGALERYWKPMCQSREGAGRMSGTLHLAQALSNRGQRGRKRDFRDAERLVKRLVSQELILSFVPDAEQCLWRTLTRTRDQRTRDKVRLQNQLEALLEEAHIKLSSLVSDLLGASARRMLKALADGETDPAALAALADQRLRATPAQLHDALGACMELNPVHRSRRSPKGNRQMRRILNQAANAAVKHKGSIFEIVYRRLVPRLGHNKTIGVIAHRLCHLIWIILHNGVRYEERGPAVSEKSRQRHTARMIRTLRILVSSRTSRKSGMTNAIFDPWNLLESRCCIPFSFWIII